ncbi:hypothetical protein CLF_103426 [Clonorchis sinensis]|uniref:Uncharacterized protein n=1 Tax=Clonorchis sinensis TaxID=79923 RepID=G7Y9Q1_CLOSI|nr:hypothetical protein CLF_103426 [Clonorchis sinensis]
MPNKTVRESKLQLLLQNIKSGKLSSVQLDIQKPNGDFAYVKNERSKFLQPEFDNATTEMFTKAEANKAASWKSGSFSVHPTFQKKQASIISSKRNPGKLNRDKKLFHMWITWKYPLNDIISDQLINQWFLPVKALGYPIDAIMSNSAFSGNILNSGLSDQLPTATEHWSTRKQIRHSATSVVQPVSPTLVFSTDDRGQSRSGCPYSTKEDLTMSCTLRIQHKQSGSDPDNKMWTLFAEWPLASIQENIEDSPFSAVEDGFSINIHIKASFREPDWSSPYFENSVVKRVTYTAEPNSRRKSFQSALREIASKKRLHLGLWIVATKTGSR